ncbi:uncharacterized protein LOC118450799 [Vespa mandarinia]|uniref:uncharacterized protein LOC118450799 n=1 Tax=Vespa mandarinia TaxID=7446 RepID=UPI001621DF62|nr:uncharacterized protein LOC118450799 [Vespa mandarinia]
MKILVNQQLQSSSEEERQNKVFVIVAETLISVNSEQLVLELEKSKMCINAFFNVLSPEYSLFFELYFERDLKNAILSFYVRLQASMKYNPEPIPYIRTPITLFKSMFLSVQHISYDYGLQKIIDGKIEEKCLQYQSVNPVFTKRHSKSFLGNKFRERNTRLSSDI